MSHRLTMPSGKAHVTHDFSVRKRVVELYHSGLGSKRIAQQLLVDDSTVRRWLRRYRLYGIDALCPYWREPKSDVGYGIRILRREENERQFQVAFCAYSSTLEPISSITRRFKLDYQSFKYHVERYHPELVAQRRRLASVDV